MAEDPNNPAVVVDPPKDPPKELEVKLATGEVFKGTPSEVIDALKAAKEQATLTIRDREGQIRGYQQEVARKTQQTPPANSDGYDSARYYEQWEKDPQQAFLYMLKHTIGIDPQEIQDTVLRGRQFQNLVELQQFVSRAGVTSLPEDQVKLLQTRLQTDGRAWTAEGLESAYAALVREGSIKPPVKEDVKTEKPNPTLTPGGGEPTETPDYNSLSTEELEKVVKQNKML